MDTFRTTSKTYTIPADDVWCGMTNSPTINTPWYYIDTGNTVNCSGVFAPTKQTDCSGVASGKGHDATNSYTFCRFRKGGNCEARKMSDQYKAVCEQAALTGKWILVPCLQLDEKLFNRNWITVNARGAFISRMNLPAKSHIKYKYAKFFGILNLKASTFLVQKLP